ncbi:DUF2652 domain-containing protein [Zeaxanthinibacter sp. PT1]|uniref:DUF2652 domain-containing protein n=1 Tax=Zeaxanthinibacter TaxID=561554 RepID=UPI00234A3827|nr:DUF2652 domain-containing protein [Zeaxanthinibacter sp. PT1]MDC6351147.1 DUF2652 domain-containing protein [Zeaxanthinibacter sp. PT1]
MDKKTNQAQAEQVKEKKSTSENVPKEAAQTLICIPDITGFTRFMSETDFKLSSKVIPSLLNKIVYSNEIGLEISEIEGDAVLFYKTGELPKLETLVSQCKKFQTEFHKQLHKLKARYSASPEADKITSMLGLKMILHFGKEVGQVPVGKRIKLIGEDVITAHLLLKNDIELDEYILLSEDLMDQYKGEREKMSLDWVQWEKDHIEDPHMGTIDFSFIPLSH